MNDYSCYNCKHKNKVNISDEYYCKTCISCNCSNIEKTTMPSNWEGIKGNMDKVKEENIEHPKHYNREGGMECLEEMILIFGKEVVKNFCLCNAWKYRYRAADKNGEEDLRKSDFYIAKYKELNDAINKSKSSGVYITPLDNNNNNNIALY